jgi:hypothetical protein
MRQRQSRVIWYVMAVLLALLAGGAIAMTKKKGGTTGRGGRAVVVPTADRARAVVVPPCATGVAATQSNASSQADTTGSVRVLLPRAPGLRVVVVPRCPYKSGGSLPSAMFVTMPGSKVPAKNDKAARNPVLQDLHSQVIVPAASNAVTIVVPPCSSNAKSGRSAVVGGPGSDVAVAPPC